MDRHMWEWCGKLQNVDWHTEGCWEGGRWSVDKVHRQSMYIDNRQVDISVGEQTVDNGRAKAVWERKVGTGLMGGQFA